MRMGPIAQFTSGNLLKEDQIGTTKRRQVGHTLKRPNETFQRAALDSDRDDRGRDMTEDGVLGSMKQT